MTTKKTTIDAFHWTGDFAAAKRWRKQWPLPSPAYFHENSWYKDIWLFNEDEDWQLALLGDYIVRRDGMFFVVPKNKWAAPEPPTPEPEPESEKASIASLVAPSIKASAPGTLVVSANTLNTPYTVVVDDSGRVKRVPVSIGATASFTPFTYDPLVWTTASVDFGSSASWTVKYITTGTDG